MSPKISIVIPVCNVEKYLARCLDTVLLQTFTDFEALCINDGSVDQSLTILEAYAQKDKRIKIFSQKNQGASVARNYGMSHARGEIIYFLDSDDCIHPRLLEICYYFLERYQADMVSFYFYSVSPTGGGIYDIPFYNTPLPNLIDIKHKVTKTPLQFCSKNSTWKISGSACTKLYRRKFVMDCPFIIGNYLEDYPHSIVLLSKHPKCVLLEENLYYYITNNSTSVSHKNFTEQHILNYHAGLSYIYNAYKDSPKKELNFVVKHIFSPLLKLQLAKIRSVNQNERKKMWLTFRSELLDLDQKGCIRLANIRLMRYFFYKRLIRGYIPK